MVAGWGPPARTVIGVLNVWVGTVTPGIVQPVIDPVPGEIPMILIAYAFGLVICSERSLDPPGNNLVEAVAETIVGCWSVPLLAEPVPEPVEVKYADALVSPKMLQAITTSDTVVFRSRRWARALRRASRWARVG
jgi:hypothetical protein